MNDNEGNKQVSADEANWGLPDEAGHSASCLMALEPRVMYDAAGAITIADSIPDADHAQDASQDSSADSTNITNLFKDYLPPPVVDHPTELVFVDASVANYQQLISGISGQQQVIILKSGEDGVAQITSELAQYSDLDAIHIVSHGGPGSLQIGSGNLSMANLNENAAQLEAWGNSLTQDGDILLYGCDVAAGSQGKEFVGQLADLTHADVAASTDVTGHTDLHGDWDMEHQVGVVEASVAVDTATQHDWHGALEGEPTPLGDEFLVNTVIEGRQTNSAVTGLNDGGFVIVWQGEGPENGTYQNFGIFGQRYDANHVAVGSEFLVNTYTTNHQQDPDVACLDNGNFVVTWSSLDQEGSSTEYEGIYAQMYDSSGAKVGGEFHVNTEVQDRQWHPSIAALNNGGFVINWASQNQETNPEPTPEHPVDGDYDNGIYGQIYDSNGTAQGSEFHVNTTVLNEQWGQQTTGLKDGGFVVTWHSSQDDGTDIAIYDVYSQLYNNAGEKIGGEHLVNTNTAEVQESADVTALEDGGYVIVWGDSAKDHTTDDIFGQRFDSTGATIGDNFIINTTPDPDVSHYQWDPTVAGLADGGFVVTWHSNNQEGSEVGIADTFGVYGQRFDADATKMGGEFRVNTTLINDQTFPAVAALTDGSFVVSWSSMGQDNPGENYDGVYSQVFGVGGETTTVDDATVVTPNVTPVSNDVTATPTTQVTPIIEPTYVEPAPIIIKPMEEFADSGMNNLFPYEPDWSDLNAKTHGNEGLGNGEDPPPPGHDVNMNDGDGASPGNPGAKDGIHKDNANILDEEYGNAKIHGNEGVGNGEDPPPPGHDENMNDGPGTSPGDPGAKHKGEEALKANEDGTGETEADQSKEAPVAPVEAGANKAEAPLPAGNKGLFKQLAAEKGIREIEQKEIKQVFEKVF